MWLLLLFVSLAFAKEPCRPVTVAVIDTGFGLGDRGHEAKLCKFGHKDFTKEGLLSKNYNTKVPVPTDVNGHGTNVTGIIDSYVKKSGTSYCIVIIKYFSKSQTGPENLAAGIKAIEYANNIEASFINYSGGGPEFNYEEYLAVHKFLDRGGRFVAAAGNDGKNIDEAGEHYFPANYDPRTIVVGNNTKSGVRSKSSNYGKSVNRWEVGEDVYAYGLTYSGTSQATAVATGKLVSETRRQCDIGF